MPEIDYPKPSVTTDIVIFTVRDNQLAVLLIERGEDPFKGCWALPGGFVDMSEDLDDGAMRELREETGVGDVYLEQLRTFGKPGRDPRGRVITVAYFALIASDRVALQASTDARDVRWFQLDEVPELAFDHADILKAAQDRLVAKLGYTTIAFQLLPESFTLSELQGVYETIRGEKLDKRNFRKWVQSLDMLAETAERRSDGRHRPARLYRLKEPREVAVVR
jgi:8-oxo-dGTP diphosphatase